MSTAEDILGERLARGEITSGEFETLAARLRAARPAPAAGTAAKSGGFLATALQLAGGGMIALAVIGGLAGGGRKNLDLGDLYVAGNVVKFRIANTGKTTGDVVFWVTQNGNEMCNRYATIKAGYTHPISVRCDPLQNGKLSVHHKWASADKSRYAVSRKID
jgi:hypothetical protein